MDGEPLTVRLGLDPGGAQPLQERPRPAASELASPRPPGDQLHDRLVRDQLSAVDDHDLVAQLGDLCEHVARDEHGSAAVGEGAQEVPQPPNPLGIEPVRGLVEHEQLGLAEQSGGHAQALPHPERVAADPAPGRIR
jgi:hypothetical protein